MEKGVSALAAAPGIVDCLRANHSGPAIGDFPLREEFLGLSQQSLAGLQKNH